MTTVKHALSVSLYEGIIFLSYFKEVYNAPNETAALTELENIKEKWGKKYPYAISNWENNWEDVSSFFQFSNDIRVSAK